MTEDRNSRIEALSISPELKNLFLGSMDVGVFNQYFEKPEYFYSQGWPENPGYWKEHEGKQLIPLWEYSECIYCADISCSPTEYISFRIDSPGEPTHYGKSIYQMVFEIIDFHCFQIAGEIESALEFMSAISFPNIEGFNRLVKVLGSVSEFEIEYEKFFNKFQSNA